MLNKLLLALAVVCFQSFPVLQAQTGSGKDTGKNSAITEIQRQRNQQSFDIVWQTIRDKHWDPKLGGLDWEKVKEEFQGKISQVQSMAEFRSLLNQMIGRLGQSHFAIIPSSSYEILQPTTNNEGKSTTKKETSSKKEEKTNPPPKIDNSPPKTDPNILEIKNPEGGGGRDGPGFEVRVVKGTALVFKIDESSPAYKLGVRSGWQILKIQGREIAPLMKEIEGSKRQEMDQTMAVSLRLRGRVGQTREVVFLNGENQEQTLAIPFFPGRGKAATLGNLPAIYVETTARTLADKVGYFHLTAFFDPPRVMKALEASLAAHRQSPGFILDLRGNPGGIGFMAAGFGGWFVDQSNLKLGTMYTRDATLNFILNPRTEPFTKPLAILVDGLSGSTSEILAGGLQDLKRARVFGTKSMGAALPSQITKLPNGDGFQFAFANYISAGGKPLEGNGVVPDEVVHLDRAALLAGRDPVVDAAVAWIRNQKTQ